VTQLTSQIQDFCITIKTCKTAQQSHTRRLIAIEKTTQDGPAGHALARALQIRMNAMQKRVEHLEAHNRALKVKVAARNEAMPSAAVLAEAIATAVTVEMA
jgi:hypothetical protein